MKRPKAENACTSLGLTVAASLCCGGVVVVVVVMVVVVMVVVVVVVVVMIGFRATREGIPKIKINKNKNTYRTITRTWKAPLPAWIPTPLRCRALCRVQIYGIR